MKECPRCHRRCLHKEAVMNSLSHLDNKTGICSKCGEHEGAVGMHIEEDEVEVLMTERFKKELGL